MLDELGQANGMCHELIAKHSKLSNLIEFALTPSSRTDLELQRKFYEEGSVMRLADTFDEVVIEWNRENNFYPMFKRGVDEDGCTYKQKFYHLVWNMLSKREQAIMATWAAGRYTD